MNIFEFLHDQYQIPENDLFTYDESKIHCQQQMHNSSKEIFSKLFMYYIIQYVILSGYANNKFLPSSLAFAKMSYGMYPKKVIFVFPTN